MHPVTPFEQGRRQAEKALPPTLTTKHTKQTKPANSLPVRRAKLFLGFLYCTLKHTYKPQVGTPIGCEGRYVLNLAR